MASLYCKTVQFIVALAGLALFVPIVATEWINAGPIGSYTGRSDNGFGNCGSKMCLLGGRTGGQNDPKPADVYDPEEKTWKEYPAPPVDIHHFQMTAVPGDTMSGCVWAGGAFKGQYPTEQYVDYIYKFCYKTGEWTEGPKIDRPRGAAGAVVYNNKYYLVGGVYGGHGTNARAVNWMDEYDPSTKQWRRMPNMPVARDHFSACMIRDKLYVAGGRDSGTEYLFSDNEPSTIYYDFASEKWEGVQQPFPTPRAGTMCMSYEDKIAYAGGEGDNSAYDLVHSFDGASYSELPRMPEPRHGTGLAYYNGYLYVAGGVSEQGDQPEVSTTLKLKLEKNPEPEPQMPKPQEPKPQYDY